MSVFSKIVCTGMVSLFVVVSSCTTNTGNGVLTPKEFKAAIEKNSDALLLDVRTAEEFATGHMDNAINVDWQKGDTFFENALQNVPKDKKILVYCQGGSRSASAAIKLEQLGYTNVQELKGGIVAWNSEFSKQAKSPENAGMTMEEFNTKLKTDKVVLVDFNAEWCPPCQKMKPFLHDIQKNMSDKVEVIFIDTDKNPQIANMFRITGLPTLMIYKNEVKKWHHEGFKDKESLIKEINNYKN